MALLGNLTCRVVLLLMWLHAKIGQFVKYLQREGKDSVSSRKALERDARETRKALAYVTVMLR